MKHGIVYAGNGLFDNYFWPSITRLKDGRLAVASSGDRLAHICPFGKVVMSTSSDEGETWTAPKVLINGPLDDRDAGITPLGDGFVITSFTLSKKFIETRIDHRSHLSSDEKKELARKRVAEITHEDELAYLGSYFYVFDKNAELISRTRMPLTAPHGFSVLNNGLLFLVGRRYIPHDYGMIDGRTDLPMEGIGYMTTPDCYHFSPISWITLPKEELARGGLFCEPHAIQLKSGRILLHIRLQYPENNKAFEIYQSVSDDGGKTFSVPAPLNTPDGRQCGSPPHLLETEEGDVVLTYGRRIEPYGECARVSRDGGETWSREIVLRDDGPSWDLGYPASVQLKSGEILTVYYQIPKGKTNRAILYTKWDYKQYL